MSGCSSPTFESFQRHYYRRPLPECCISFHSDEGKKIFTEALLDGYMEAYFGLAAQFRTQDEPAFCGLSTLVMVLNTLEVNPWRVWKGPWRWYHEQMLDCCLPLDEVEKNGINLEQFACLATCNTLKVQMVRADESASLEDFREVIRSRSRQTREVVVVSYCRRTVGQTGDGHFSPIAGYHPERDLALIMDVARFKYPPHWVSVPRLFESMQQLDSDTGLFLYLAALLPIAVVLIVQTTEVQVITNKCDCDVTFVGRPRGYFILQKSLHVPLVMFRLSECLSIPTSSETSDTIHAFIHHWMSWLISRYAGETEMELISKAIAVFAEALQYLPSSDAVLSTQIDSLTEISKEHFAAIKILLASLEHLPLFKEVSQVVRELGLEQRALLEKVGSCQAQPVPDQFVNICFARSCSLIDDRLIENSNGRSASSAAVAATCGRCGRFCVKLEHFVSILLLSWPYCRSVGTVGQAMLKLVRRQMNDSTSPSDELTNETTQLRKQLTSISGYLLTCDTCVPECNCSIREPFTQFVLSAI